MNRLLAIIILLGLALPGRGAADPAAQRRISTIVPPRAARMPAVLAAAAPPAQRASSEATYARLLATYEKIAPQHGVTARDVAGALALYLCASYAVYHDVDFTASMMAKVTKQVRTVIVKTPEFASATTADRQDMYEQYAILGMTMGAARSVPITAEARSSAKGYLEAFLKVGVDSIQISEAGLVITGGASPAPDPTPAAPAPATSPDAEAAETTETTETSADARTATRRGELAIEAIAFRQRQSDGMMVMTPFVLFKSGEAALDMDALAFPGGHDAHRAKYPGQWTKWRRAGKALEIIVCKPVDRCKKPPYWWRVPHDFTKSGLPKGFKLDGSYGTSSGSLDGTVTSSQWRNLRFHKDGRFSTSNFGSHSVTLDHGSPTKQRTIAGGHGSKQDGGTYLVDGYYLTLRHDDGTAVKRTIVADPRAQVRLMWLDGNVYTRSDE